LSRISAAGLCLPAGSTLCLSIPVITPYILPAFYLFYFSCFNLTGTVYTISDYFSILTFGNLAKSLPGHNIVPVIEVFRLGNPEHGEKFLHIRTDLWEKIFLFCKEFRIISQLSPIFPKGTVK